MTRSLSISWDQLAMDSKNKNSWSRRKIRRKNSRLKREKTRIWQRMRRSWRIMTVRKKMRRSWIRIRMR